MKTNLKQVNSKGMLIYEIYVCTERYRMSRCGIRDKQ